MAVNATAVWRVRPSGNNVNGGGYDAGISGAATDYSQQNAAQASGSNGTATGTTTFIDATANAFTSAMVGNAIWIASGAGFTVGAYFVTAFTSASTVTLDSSPGTGTVAVWKLGGGWADFVTNTANGSTPIVAGNIVYVLGSGTPNPASYVYDYTVTSAFTFANGSGQAGGYAAPVSLANDPLTPGYKAPPDTTGGMPTVKVNTVAANFMAISQANVFGIWFVANSMNAGQIIILTGNGAGAACVFGCVFDQFGNDIISAKIDTSFASTGSVLGCEVYSSSGGSGGSNYAIAGPSALPAIVANCNIHDCVGGGVSINTGPVMNCIIAKCSGNGVLLGVNSGDVIGCTIDANGGNGIQGNPASIINSQLFSNIISNHVTGGTFGIKFSQSGTVSYLFMDYNTFYNNTTDISNSAPYGPHDTHGGSNPYVGQSTENYTLA